MKPRSRKRFAVYLFFLAIVLSGCDGNYTPWERNKVVHGIEFAKLRYGIDDGEIRSIIGYLKDDTVIDGYPCAADWVHFAADWQLTLFRLAKPAVINNYSYGADTWIRFVHDRVTCVFPKNTSVQGYLCRGGGGVTGVHTSFYESGRLRFFYPVGDVDICGICCSGSVFSGIGLYEDGTLRECTLMQPVVIDGISYPKNSRLTFDEAGAVTSASIM
ncbi:MAG: hypothetical protein PHV61_02840 [Limnochordia bacterium]|jgi:hypothetical protein|nr:hypothetical protein [Limnochordia bacterium]MDD2629095.1 hypothetical protein [Limnochordia bacterium]MDD4517171.1 hypothetical protein [Limnochordia bacterium]